MVVKFLTESWTITLTLSIPIDQKIDIIFGKIVSDFNAMMKLPLYPYVFDLTRDKMNLKLKECDNSSRRLYFVKELLNFIHFSNEDQIISIEYATSPPIMAFSIYNQIGP